MKGKTRFLSFPQIPAKTKTLLSSLQKENLLKGYNSALYIERAAYYRAELNYIHPFREGNGRATREFMRTLFLIPGYHVNWNNINRDMMLEAMELSVYDPKALIPILEQCISM